MDPNVLKTYVGLKVNIHINYKGGLSAPLPVVEKGWFLYSYVKNAYTLAFYTKMGNLDFLPVFTHDEVDSLYQCSTESLDMQQVAPEWRVNNIKQKLTGIIEKEDNKNDGRTKKSEYQTSGFDWL